MRTTIDIPDSLLSRVKKVLQKNRTTFRSVVISALERELEEEPRQFKLRDASVGSSATQKVSAEEINDHIDELRNPAFRG